MDAPSATVHRIGWFIIADLDYFGIKRVTCMQRIVLIIISNIEMSDICVFPYIYIRDLTIRQRRRPWKRRWQIDFVSVHLFSRLFSGAQLLKRKEFGLELKRRDRARVQAEMVEFIASPFPFPSKPQKNFLWACVTRFSKSWPYFRQKNVVFHTRFQTRPL